MSCPTDGIAPWVSSVHIKILVNINVLQFLRFGPARNFRQKDCSYKSKPSYRIIEDINLAAHTFRYSITADWFVGDAVLKNFIILIVPNLVEVVRIRVLEGIAVPAHVL